MSKLFAKKIIDKFNLSVIAGDDKVNNVIEVYGINRAGLELTGYFENADKNHRIIVMSTKEYSYIMNFDEKEREKRYLKLFQSKIPMIIITSKFEDEVAINVAKKLNILFTKTNSSSTSDFTQNVLDYMDDFFAPTIEMHASCINVFGKGILLIGQSGIGKSEITMDLIKANHLFVGDDRVIIIKKGNEIFAKCHPILKNLVEVRGIGIMDVSQTNGYQVILDQTKVDLVIELSKYKQNGVDDYERLGQIFNSFPILGTSIPHIKIPVSSGRNIPNIIEVAVAKLKIKEYGVYRDETSILNERVLNYQDE